MNEITLPAHRIADGEYLSWLRGGEMRGYLVDGNATYIFSDFKKVASGIEATFAPEYHANSHGLTLTGSEKITLRPVHSPTPEIRTEFALPENMNAMLSQITMRGSAGYVNINLAAFDVGYLLATVDMLTQQCEALYAASEPDPVVIASMEEAKRFREKLGIRGGAK